MGSFVGYDHLRSARPEEGGFQALQRIRADFPTLPVLIVNLYTMEQYAFRAFQPRVSGFLGKDSTSDELLSAVSQIRAGKKYIANPLDN